MFPPITELLPHRGKAVLLKQITALRDGCICVEACFDAGHPYALHERIPGLINIELAAQAAALHRALTGGSSSETIRPGLLLSVSRLDLVDDYAIGETALLSATLTAEAGHDCEYEFEAQVGGKVRARGAVLLRTALELTA